jgi:peptidoglycan/LPS O-acetylase OafA/YrhL
LKLRGIYLYGFVIQQSVARMGSWTHHWYVNLPLSLLAAIVFAGLFWDLIERPSLKLKNRLPALEERVSMRKLLAVISSRGAKVAQEIF